MFTKLSVRLFFNIREGKGNGGIFFLCQQKRLSFLVNLDAHLLGREKSEE